MKMIGHENNSINIERAFSFNVSKCLTQDVDIVFVVKQLAPLIRYQSEKEGTSGSECASILQLDFLPIH